MLDSFKVSAVLEVNLQPQFRIWFQIQSGFNSIRGYGRQ